MAPSHTWQKLTLRKAVLIVFGWIACAGLVLTTQVVTAQEPADARVVQDTMAQRMQACVVCHGPQGRASNEGYLPRIAGKPAGYLYNQLLNFRDGRRNNLARSRLLAHLSDDYLREIADYFAALDLPYPSAPLTEASPAVLSLGSRLVLEGDTARGIPACVQCHGQQMTGVAPAMPGLLGLQRDYLIGQMGAWRNGLRQAWPPDCMATVARRLSTEEVSAVATWLASRSLPVDAAPVSADRAGAHTVAALPCGSG